MHDMRVQEVPNWYHGDIYKQSNYSVEKTTCLIIDTGMQTVFVISTVFAWCLLLSASYRNESTHNRKEV